MTGYISDKNGAELRLPEPLEWEVIHTLGEPCDSFSLTCLYETGMSAALRAACRFRAEHGGARVFTGVLDEYQLRAGEGGMTATLNGRGLAALLMDNEAESAEYSVATLDFMLERHAAPWGISAVRKKAMGSGAFQVSPGWSQWRALREFCRFFGEVEPRFDRSGVLLLDGSPGEARAITLADAVTEQRYIDSRYGVVSSVLVSRRYGGGEAVVENAELTERGGSARRVIYVPRRTGYDAMRCTGSWQIRESARGAEECRLTLPEPFAAFAGDTVTLWHSPLGVTGDFVAAESRCRADGSGAETILKLWRR